MGYSSEKLRTGIWATYGAQIAAAVSGVYDLLPVYRAALAAPGYTFADCDLLDLAEQAFALGFQDKWPEETVEDK